jgi:hypothetical protein
MNQLLNKYTPADQSFNIRNKENLENLEILEKRMVSKYRGKGIDPTTQPDYQEIQRQKADIQRKIPQEFSFKHFTKYLDKLDQMDDATFKKEVTDKITDEVNMASMSLSEIERYFDEKEKELRGAKGLFDVGFNYDGWTKNVERIKRLMKSTQDKLEKDKKDIEGVPQEDKEDAARIEKVIEKGEAVVNEFQRDLDNLTRELKAHQEGWKEKLPEIEKKVNQYTSAPPTYGHIIQVLPKPEDIFEKIKKQVPDAAGKMVEEEHLKRDSSAITDIMLKDVIPKITQLKEFKYNSSTAIAHLNNYSIQILHAITSIGDTRKAGGTAEVKALSELKRKLDKALNYWIAYDKALAKIIEQISANYLKGMSSVENIPENIYKKIADALKFENLSEQLYRGKAASQDDPKQKLDPMQQISSPDKYLEKTPDPYIKDWRILEILYEKDVDEFGAIRDLQRSGTIFLQNAHDLDKVRVIGEKANELEKRILKFREIRNLVVKLGGLEIKVSDVGRKYNELFNEYIKNKNPLLQNQLEFMNKRADLLRDIASSKDILKEGPIGVVGTNLTDTEVQAITNAFHRSMYWALMKYWSTGVGGSVVFGEKVTPEFMEMYDTFKNLTGVKSNPIIQTVINTAVSSIRTLKGLRKLLRDMKSQYKQNGMYLDLDDLERDYDKKVEEARKKAKASGEDEDAAEASVVKPELHKSKDYDLLKLRINNLKALVDEKKVMWDKLHQEVDIDNRLSVLKELKNEVKDPALIKRISDKMNDLEALKEAKIKRQAKDAEDLKSKVEQSETPEEKEAIERISKEIIPGKTPKVPPGEQSGIIVPTEQPETTKTAKEYMKDKNFNIKLLYGPVMQKTICEMALRNMSN